MVSLLPCLLLVLLPFAAAEIYEPCDSCTDRATTEELNKLSLRLYLGGTVDNHIDAPVGSAGNLIYNMNTTKPTVLHIHGWTEDPDADSCLAIIGAYLERGDHNVILANYGAISSNAYPYVAYSAPGIGYTFARALNDLVAKGLDSSSLCILSHSMGSQIAGFVGQYTSFKLARIIGLDPAGPGFEDGFSKLNVDAAELVYVIHTDAGVYGTTLTDFTANFYPNLGVRLQPGCELSDSMTVGDFCNHYKSWQFYAESVLKEDAFVGVKCHSASDFLSGKCGNGETDIMGYGTSENAKGFYYLQTNVESPFGRGAIGCTYDSTVFTLSADN